MAAAHMRVVHSLRSDVLQQSHQRCAIACAHSISSRECRTRLPTSGVQLGSVSALPGLAGVTSRSIHVPRRRSNSRSTEPRRCQVVSQLAVLPDYTFALVSCLLMVFGTTAATRAVPLLVIASFLELSSGALLEPHPQCWLSLLICAVYFCVLARRRHDRLTPNQCNEMDRLRSCGPTAAVIDAWEVARPVLAAATRQYSSIDGKCSRCMIATLQ